MPTRPTIARLAAVSQSRKEEMFALHDRYFANVARDAFMRDMNEKDWIILLKDERDSIVGFSTLQILRLPVDNREHVFLFSGDTIVDAEHRLNNALAGSFGHFMLRLMDIYPVTPLHWFLISKGYRTYRFLPVFFRRFHPVYDQETPVDRARLLDAVAAFKFGPLYDPASGIIRVAGVKDRLRPDFCGVPESRRNDPHVQFFLRSNPRWDLGDELSCITDIARSNLSAYAWRAIAQTVVAWDEERQEDRGTNVE